MSETTLRRDRSGRPRGERRPPLRPLPRGVRGRRRLQALAGEDRHRVRRPPVLPDHDEPPPAAHQRRLRGAVPAGAQRRRRPARLLAGARHVGQRRQRQGDREPRDRRTQAPGAGVPRRHAVLRVRGAREERVAVEARPRHRQGAHPRPQPGRRAGGRVQAAGARAAPGPRRGRYASARRVSSRKSGRCGTLSSTPPEGVFPFHGATLPGAHPATGIRE